MPNLTIGEIFRRAGLPYPPVNEIDPPEGVMESLQQALRCLMQIGVSNPAALFGWSPARPNTFVPVAEVFWTLVDRVEQENFNELDRVAKEWGIGHKLNALTAVLVVAERDAGGIIPRYKDIIAGFEAGYQCPPQTPPEAKDLDAFDKFGFPAHDEPAS